MSLLSRTARVVPCLVLILLTFSMVASAQAPQGATLTVVSGETSVVRSNGSASQPAANGLTLAVGDQVATVGNYSTALVTFFEGSELELGANTTIILKEIRSTGNEVHVTVEDVLGTTVSRVQAFANSNSSFSVQSPGGTAVAAVRGSEINPFTVYGTGGGRIAVACPPKPGEIARPCQVIIGGRVVWEGTGTSPEFTYDQNLSVQVGGDPDRTVPGGGGQSTGNTPEGCEDCDKDEPSDEEDDEEDEGGCDVDLVLPEYATIFRTFSRPGGGC